MMTYKYILILITLLFKVNMILSQSISDSAIIYMKNGEYQKADSLYSELLVTHDRLYLPILADHGTVILNPLNDLFYNKAQANLFLGDTAIFCREMHNAAEFYDTAAFAYYCKVCLGKQVDTIYLDKNLQKTTKKKSHFTEIVYFDKFRNLLFGEIINPKNKAKNKHSYYLPDNIISYSSDLIGKFVVKGADTVFYYNEDQIKSTDYSKCEEKLRNDIEVLKKNPESKAAAFEKYHVNKIVVILTIEIDEKGKCNSIRLFDLYPKQTDIIYFNEAKLVTKLALETWDYVGKVRGRKVMTEENVRVEFKLIE